MKNNLRKNYPKGFVSIKKRVPNVGRNVVILDKYGNSYRCIKVDKNIYEDVNMISHFLSDIVAWKR